MKERSLKDLFHRVSRLLPEDQELVVVPPDTPARDALDIMREHNFTQVPIVQGSEVLGVFSYRSFSEGVLQLASNERDPAGLPVEVFSEKLMFASVTDELANLLDELDLKEVVLVGSEDRLQGIVTAVDTLRYFYRIASPFVMLGEIELSIRELIRASVTDQDLRACVDKCLTHYAEEKRPRAIEEMCLADYITILTWRELWPTFRDAFGGAYTVARAKLGPLPKLRNDVFHFKRELLVEEYDSLRDCRDWLLTRIRKADATRRGTQHE